MFQVMLHWEIWLVLIVFVPWIWHRELTDRSLKDISQNCPGLRAIDLSDLCKLTDSAIEHLATGCREVDNLKLCRNPFRFPKYSNWPDNIFLSVAYAVSLAVIFCLQSLSSFCVALYSFLECQLLTSWDQFVKKYQCSWF